MSSAVLAARIRPHRPPQTQQPKRIGTPTKGLAAGWLPEVFAHLGDAEHAAHWWDVDLRHERTRMLEQWDWEMALLMGSLHLEPVWGSEQLQRVRDRWSAT